MESTNSGRYRINARTMQLEKISDAIPSITTDVYFKEPHFDEHLADAKHPQGQEVRSKKHKSRIMKEQGVREAGDRRHGARMKFDGSGENAFR